MNEITLSDEDDGFWWDAVAAGELLLTNCRTCHRTWVRSMPGCPYCGGTSLRVITSTGRGSIYSWIVAHWAFDRSFRNEVPYIVLTVDLDEGARIHGRLFDAVPSQLRDGGPVSAVFYERDGRHLVGFRTVDE